MQQCSYRRIINVIRICKTFPKIHLEVHFLLLRKIVLRTKSKSKLLERLVYHIEFQVLQVWSRAEGL